MIHIVFESMDRESYLGMTENRSFGSKWKDGDVIGFAFDAKSKLFTFSVNGNNESPNS